MRPPLPTHAFARGAAALGLLALFVPLALTGGTGLAAIGLATVAGGVCFRLGQQRGRKPAEEALRRTAERLADAARDAALGLEPDTSAMPPEAAEPLVRLGSLLRSERERALTAENTAADARVSATEAGRARSEFLATMSHELRTPLNGSLGMLSLLLDTELDHEQREYAVTAKRSCLGLAGMIDEILDFATLETNRLVLDRDEFKLSATIWDVVDSHAQRAAQRGLGLSFHEEQELPIWALGDRKRFMQVLGLLLDNAIKFTHEGEVALRARVAGRDAKRVRLAFELSDTGIGIPEQKREHVFTAFTQADQTNTRAFSGAGLGLVIVKRLLERMDGTIDFVSEPDHGTTFRFELVLDLPQERRQERPREHVVSNSAVAVLCTANPSFAEAFSAQLESLGFHVQVVMDPDVALALRRQDPPAFLWVDDTLPDIELHELRCALAEEKLPGGCLHVLLHGPDDIQPHEGFQSHLERPPRPSLLRAFVMRLVENSVPAALPAQPRSEHPKRPRGTPDRIRYEGRVLVVEDNPVNRRVVTALLEKRGLDVETAANGVEALTMLRIVCCDLVLMDVHMPEMDGIEATRRIRAGEGGPSLDVPIVALTAGDRPEDRAACAEAGMEDYIRKPLTEADLDTVLCNWLQEVTPVED